MKHYRAMCQFILIVMLLTFFGLSSAYAMAVESAGKIIASNGQVQAVNAAGESRSLKRGDVFFVMDTVTTADKSTVSLQFSDGTLLELKEKSSFKIAAYKFDKNNPADDSYFAELVKGGFRTITGALGKRSPDEFEIKARMTTLTVRGTKLMMEFTEKFEVQVGVIEGAVQLTADGNVQDVTANESVIVRRDGRMQIYNRIPATMLEGYSSSNINALQEQAATNNGSTSPEDQPTTFIEGEGAQKPKDPVGSGDGGSSPCEGISSMSGAM